MKHVVASLIIGTCLLLPSAGVVFAVDPPHGSLGPHPGGNAGLPNGQPGTQPAGTPQTGAACGTATGGTPPPGQALGGGGNGSSSPFPLGLGSSKVYAGSAGNSGSGHANSQYDVACFQPH
jgi:hypothetical protein